MSIGIITNLVSTLIAFVFGILAQEAYRRWRNVRPARRVWKLDKDAKAVIVTSTGPQDPYPTLFEPDALAAAAVSQYLGHMLGVTATRTVASSNFSAARDMEENIIVIGGPAANSLYDRLADRVSCPYTFDRHQGTIGVIPRTGSARYQYGVDGGTVHDYAIVTIADNPFRSTSRVVLVAGCEGPATVAATRMLTSDKVRQVARLIKPKHAIALVITTEEIDGYLRDAHIVEHMTWHLPISSP